MSRNDPPNVEIAKRIGVTDGAVCRFRRGSRVPLMRTMQAIADAYGWTIEAQATAVAAGRYAEDFEHAVGGSRPALADSPS